MPIHAPDFPPSASWLNTHNAPLHLHTNLKGHLLLLHFFTFSCINCIHTLPDLAFLEQKYKDAPFLILGIHSPKFDHAKSPSAVQAAAHRHHLHHPILLDPHHTTWDAYAIPSWPTLTLIGPDAKIIGQVSGEGHRNLLDQSIARALQHFQSKNLLTQTPLKFPPPPPATPSPTQLSFPTKLLHDPHNNRLLLLDSGHNRILLTSLPNNQNELTLLQTIGTGHIGNTDGPSHTASFHHPQGACLSPNGQILYLADTQNHLLRRIDRQKNLVSTLLGTGQQKFDHEAGKSSRDQPLNSPWDCAVSGNRLYISQAGQHQLFSTNLMTLMTEVAAGTAREALRDGPALDAQLAQPSPLALDPASQTLYFLDAESSALRALDLKSKTLTTLLGHGLFDFGDTDGPPHHAQLQHPLGLSRSADNNSLYIADTFNHKIKQFDLQTKTLTTLYPIDPAATPLNEPTSILPLPNTNDLLIADTNNHRLLRINPHTQSHHPLTLKQK
ncbi:MAG: redoxin domain-containing protein [Phycisphaerae bacterium]